MEQEVINGVRINAHLFLHHYLPILYHVLALLNINGLRLLPWFECLMDLHAVDNQTILILKLLTN